MRSLLIVVALFISGYVHAQLEARIIMDHQQYLLYEPIEGRLVIKNTSGRDLKFDPSQFTFFGRMFRHQHLDRLEDSPIIDPIIIPAGQRRETKINFSKIFRAREAGPYTFGGRIDYFGRMINLPYAYVDIVTGVEIFKQETLSDMETNPTHRLIRLISMMRDGDINLFLSIEDPVRRLSYGVYELGTQLAQGKPVVEMGSENEVHVLHRTSPAQYVHSIFTLNGTPVSQEVFDASGSPPKIRRDRFGDVSVMGGKVEVTEESRIKPFTLD